MWTKVGLSKALRRPLSCAVRRITPRCSRTGASVAALPLAPAAEREYRWTDGGDEMDSQASAIEPHRGWFSVSVVVGLVMGALPVLVGWVIAIAGHRILSCRQFGDLGCAGFFAIGVLYVCPLGAVVGATIGGLNAAHMAKRRQYVRRMVWKRSFALAFLSLLVLGSSVTLLVSS